MKLSITVAMTLNRVIGTKNSLPWYLPEDLKKVKSLTTGHILIMGRRTFESLPHVLPNRDHYVVTRNSDYKNTNSMARESEHVFIAGTPAEALEMVQTRLQEDASIPEEVFIFGGGADRRRGAQRVTEYANFPGLVAACLQPIHRAQYILAFLDPIIVT